MGLRGLREERSGFRVGLESERLVPGNRSKDFAGEDIERGKSLFLKPEIEM
jgi:hypothetical protein